MKLKSLILGSVAAAGLSTAGFAADLGVLTSLDVCDSLGISGLTISSSTNCLAITGEVSYDFTWGDYADTGLIGGTDTLDWESEVEAWVQFVGTASSDFGPASATIRLSSTQGVVIVDENDPAATPTLSSSSDTGVVLDRAFVSIGDTTVITAGLVGDELEGNGDFGEIFGWSDLYDDNDGFFSSSNVKGITTGGHAIQVTSTLADGVKAGVGIENLGGEIGVDTVAGPPVAVGSAGAGTLVGFVSYAGSGIAASVYAAAGGILEGEVDAWLVNADLAANFDNFNVYLAGHYTADDQNASFYSLLAAASATFDMFTLAGNVGVNGGEDFTGTALANGLTFGGSIGAKVTDTVAINLAGIWIDNDTSTSNDEDYIIAVQLVADLSDAITLTTEVGFESDTASPATTNFYADAELEWTPGGNFESYVGARFEQTGAYSVRVGASKEFK
jgi:hypothetical protein